MAAADDLKKLQEQIEQLRKQYKDLTGKPAALFDVSNTEKATSAVDTLTKAIADAKKEAAKAKLMALGLTADDLKALLG